MDRITFDATGALDGNTLSGIAHVFGLRSTDGRDMPQVFDVKAFDKSIRAGKVMGFYSHDVSRPLASMKAGSLRLEVRDGKLHYGMDLGQQSYALDLRENAASGLMTSMSFGVFPIKSTVVRGDDGVNFRLHTLADLFDISPVAMAAFEGTRAKLHAAGVDPELRASARAWRASHGG